MEANYEKFKCQKKIPDLQHRQQVLQQPVRLRQPVPQLVRHRQQVSQPVRHQQQVPQPALRLRQRVLQV
ncbi:unnamed protein product [Adineta steineri]|uniref:Uncharacterized protein n=1 Tax=Adineta steineri TaxID=433720 RepID=A0A814GSY9_9BILA|nr:unnamed protein product [Adineta steineri]